MSGTDEDVGRGPPRLLLAALCACAVANVYYAQPLLARIGIDLGIPTSHLGWVVTLSQLGYLLGLIVLVPLGDLLSRRVLVAVQLGLTTIGTGIAATASGPVALLLGVTIAGLFSVVVQVAIAFAAAISHPAARGRTIGVVTSGVVIGIIGARAVSGAVADLAGWRAVYLGSAIACATLATAAAVALPRDDRCLDGEENRRGRYIASLASVVVLTLTDRLFRTRSLTAFFVFASFGVLWSGMALPLAAAPWHLSTTEIGLFGVAGLAGALGAARAGRWADRGHGEVVTTISLVLLVLSWAAIGRATSSLLLLAVGVVVLDFAVQAVHVTGQNRLVTTRPEVGSRLIGSYMVFYSLGSALGAITATTLYDRAGWGAVSVAGAGFAAAALLVRASDRTTGPTRITRPRRCPRPTRRGATSRSVRAVPRTRGRRGR